MTEQSSFENQDMSGSSNDQSAEFIEKQFSWNILAEHHGIKIDEKFILKLINGTENVNQEEKNSCKVLHFSSEWNFEKLLGVLDRLNPKEYPNLFVIIIEGRYFGFNFECQPMVEPPEKKIKMYNIKIEEILKRLLLKLGDSRPLILQLTSEDENMTKFCYKEKTLDHFIDIDQTTEYFDERKDFPTLLCSFLNGKIENVAQITAVWQPIIKFSIALKLLKLFENLFYRLILEVAKSGTIADLLTILEAPIEHEGRVLTIEAQQYLSEMFYEGQVDNEPTEHIEDTEELNSYYSSPESDYENILVDKLSSSVLLTAIKNKNTEVIDYLITYWTHLIQQLPLEHQVKISTAAFETDQLDVLCDLLEIADFPFPEDYEFDDDQQHERLREIVLHRMAFTNAIKRENFEKIDKLIDSNLSMKYAYNIDNETALTQAINLKKFGVFYYLKSIGYQGEDCEDILSTLDKDEKKKATKQAVEQRKKNVKLALVNVHKSVLLLATKCLIHNRKVTKEREADYRQKIMKWLQDIYNIAPEMLDVAATCEKLKIVFDFESDSVGFMNFNI